METLGLPNLSPPLRFPKVCVYGLWHLGVVTSACLAELGYKVTGASHDGSVITNLSHAKAPLFEPGLDELVSKHLNTGNLRFGSDLEKALDGSDFFILAVDTPINEHDEVDLSSLYSIIREAAKILSDNVTIIVSSQVPIGTCDEFIKLIISINPTLKFELVCVPENLRLGRAIERFMNPDMVVIGSQNSIPSEKARSLFAPLGSKIVDVDLKTAEMSKHVINTYLGTMISFANEVANLSDQVGADGRKVLEVLSLDSRVSPRAPLKPGLGFGGGTLARDLTVLSNLGKLTDVELNLVEGVIAVNQNQNRRVASKLKRFYGSFEGLIIGVYGLSYKSGTSSIRRSPALEIIKYLTEQGAFIKAHDPKLVKEDLDLYADQFEFFSDPYVVASGSHAIFFVTDWPEFSRLDFQRIKTSMVYPVLLDALNMLNSDYLKGLGFMYQGVGRGL